MGSSLLVTTLYNDSEEKRLRRWRDEHIRYMVVMEAQWARIAVSLWSAGGTVTWWSCGFGGARQRAQWRLSFLGVLRLEARHGGELGWLRWLLWWKNGVWVQRTVEPLGSYVRSDIGWEDTSMEEPKKAREFSYFYIFTVNSYFFLGLCKDWFWYIVSFRLN